MKQAVQSVLSRMGLYERIKSSAAYDWYWRLADPAVLAARRREHAFYRALLPHVGNGDVIFDIGANQGAKTNVFLSLGAKVIAVDPDETNQQILARSFLKMRVTPRPVVVIGKAVSDGEGVAEFLIDEPGSAKNTVSTKWADVLRHDGERFGKPLRFGQRRQVATTTLEALIAEHGIPKFIKIDVEGHELSVLRGLQTRVPCVSFEVNLPEFQQEGLLGVERLATLDPQGRFNIAAEGGDGLQLQFEPWLSAAECAKALAECKHRSIEIIWKPVPAAASH